MGDKEGGVPIKDELGIGSTETVCMGRADAVWERGYVGSEFSTRIESFKIEVCIEEEPVRGEPSRSIFAVIGGGGGDTIVGCKSSGKEEEKDEEEEGGEENEGRSSRSMTTKGADSSSFSSNASCSAPSSSSTPSSST